MILAPLRGRKRCSPLCAAILTSMLPFGAALAQEPARCTAVEGALLTRGDGGKWSAVAKGAVPADRLLIALFGAEFTSANGGVEAKLVADVGQRGPFPVLEAAAKFHAPKDADLEMSLERGILILTNVKKKGAARIHLRKRNVVIEVTLPEPKDRLAVEMYGRHLPGPAEVSDPKLDEPVMNVAFFAVSGEAILNTTQHAIRLHAPPGPALLLWDSVTRTPEVMRFETLPESAKPMNADERKLFDALNGHAKQWSVKPAAVGEALAKATNSTAARERTAAVVGLGALDELSGLLAALANKDHADVRDQAVLVFRHWLGRAPGQSVRLFQHLTTSEKLTATQAKNLIHFFNGFEEARRRQPETYQLLIEKLEHPRIEARTLAHWHLVRLAPAGQKIAYDAGGPEAERAQAVAAWRRLIPPGQLPPPPVKKETPK